jgi:hypothetical protein
MPQPIGGPRQKFRQQLEGQGKSEAEVERILDETFGPGPKRAPRKKQAKKKSKTKPTRRR